MEIYHPKVELLMIIILFKFLIKKKTLGTVSIGQKERIEISYAVFKNSYENHTDAKNMLKQLRYFPLKLLQWVLIKHHLLTVY